MSFYIGIAFKQINNKYIDVCVFPTTGKAKNISRSFIILKKKEPNSINPGFTNFVNNMYNIEGAVISLSVTEEPLSKSEQKAKLSLLSKKNVNELLNYLIVEKGLIYYVPIVFKENRENLPKSQNDIKILTTFMNEQKRINEIVKHKLHFIDNLIQFFDTLKPIFNRFF